MNNGEGGGDTPQQHIYYLIRYRYGPLLHRWKWSDNSGDVIKLCYSMISCYQDWHQPTTPEHKPNSQLLSGGLILIIIMDFVDCGGKHLEIIARSVFLIVWNNQTIFFLSGRRARILWTCCGLLGVFSREWFSVTHNLSEVPRETILILLREVKFLNWNACQGTLWCWPSQPTTPRRDMSHLWWTGWRGKSHLKSGNNYCLHTQVWYDCFNQSCFGF